MGRRRVARVPLRVARQRAACFPKGLARRRTPRFVKSVVRRRAVLCACVCVSPLARAAEAPSKSSRARGPKTRGRLSRVIGPKARGMPLPAAWPKYVWYDFLLCMARKHVVWISSPRGQNMCRTLPHSMARKRLVCFHRRGARRNVVCSPWRLVRSSRHNFSNRWSEGVWYPWRVVRRHVAS